MNKHLKTQQHHGLDHRSNPVKSVDPEIPLCVLGEIKTTAPAEDVTRRAGGGFQVDTGASDITDDEKKVVRKTHHKNDPSIVFLQHQACQI